MSESTFDYVLQCEALREQVAGRDILVTRWRGTEAVSQLYRFDITVAVRGARLDLEPLLDKPATLRLRHPDGTTGRWHGIVTQCAEHGHDENYDYYQLTLEPRLARLRLQQWSDVYLDKPFDELIEDLLKEARLTEKYSGDDAPYDYRIVVPGADLVPLRRPFTCQFEETCLNFLMRKLEFYGVYFWFEQGDERESLVFGNDESQQPAQPREAIYYPKGALDPDITNVVIERMDRRASMAPSSVSLRALNDHDNTARKLRFEAEVSGVRAPWGQVQSVADHFSVLEGRGDSAQGAAGEALARWRAQELACHTQRVQGEASTPGVCAGRFLAVSEYHVQARPLQYYVISVEHEGTQTLDVSPTSDEPPYRARFVALPRWRDPQNEADPVQFRPPRTTPVPRASRLLTGFVDIEDEKKPNRYAKPDEHGRYKVRLPFVRRRHEAYKNSPWLRQSTPYAAGAAQSDLKKAGLHFPLREGTEVLIAFLNEDPDLPVIVGSLPNIEAPSVVAAANAREHVLRTPGGSGLTIMDGGAGAASAEEGSSNTIEDESHISLSTPMTSASLTLGTVPPPPPDKDGKTPPAKNGFKLTSNLNGEVHAGEFLLIEVPGHYRVAAGGTERTALSNFLGSSVSLAPGIKASQSGGIVIENFMGAKFSSAEQATFGLTVGSATDVYAGLKFGATFAVGATLAWSLSKDVNLNDKWSVHKKYRYLSPEVKQKIGKKSSLSVSQETKAVDYSIETFTTYSVKGPNIKLANPAGVAELQLVLGEASLTSQLIALVESMQVKVSGLESVVVQALGGASKLELGTTVELSCQTSMTLRTTAGPARLLGGVVQIG